MKKSKLTAKNVEDKFNAGEDLTEFFTDEVDPATYEPKKKKISAELPTGMVNQIDAIVAKTGDSRNTVIRRLIAKSLEPNNEESYLKRILEKLVDK